MHEPTQIKLVTFKATHFSLGASMPCLPSFHQVLPLNSPPALSQPVGAVQVLQKMLKKKSKRRRAKHRTRTSLQGLYIA